MEKPNIFENIYIWTLVLVYMFFHFLYSPKNFVEDILYSMRQAE